MRYVISIDPATETGLASIAYTADANRPPNPKLIWSDVVKLKKVTRPDWFPVCDDAMQKALKHCAANLWGHNGTEMGLEQKPIVLIEDWARHLAYSTAKRLAQIQQVWVDAAANHGMAVIFIPVLDWQVPTGVNKIRDSKHGKGARKRASQAWAQGSYRLEKAADHNISDALCMAAVWLQNQHHRRVEK